MNTQDFKTQIKSIRKEAIKIGFAKATIDSYYKIWKSYIKWKNDENFNYDEKDYSKFLLDIYNFDVNTFSSKKSKSWFQQLMRSKRILDDFDSYKVFITKELLPRSIYNIYPEEWMEIINNYKKYCKEVRSNSNKTTETKFQYAKKILSYFYQNGINDIKELNKNSIIQLVNLTVDRTYRVKERYLYTLKHLLNYLFIDDILKDDLTIYVPKIKKESRKKIPTYLKPCDIEKLLNSINQNTKLGKRDYCIILLSARYGLRISDILNIKLKDIDWQNNKLLVEQPKTHNLNVLPLTKEVGWSIINYIKYSRPKCESEYLFVKMNYPFDKMTQFIQFNKYFESANINVSEENKKGIHNLRHSLATNMLNNEIPIDIIASTIGDTIETTSNTYIKTSDKLLSECSLEVEQ